MGYLLLQIFICLLVAFLIGLFIGWWIWRNRCQNRLRDLEAEIDRTRKALADCMAARGSGATPVGSRRGSGGGATSSATASATGFGSGVGVGAGAPLAAAAIPVRKSAPDDLKKIWGIGPKMEQILNGAGIHTFAAVAETPVTRLREVVAAYGSKRLTDIANEETWPEQAALAARGDWDGLKAYQSELSWRSGGKPSDG